MTPKHRYGLRISPGWTTEKQRPWFVINIQWFAKDWHIFQLLSTHKMCQPLAKDCIIHFLPWTMVDRYISTFCQNWPISNYCKELTENSVNLKMNASSGTYRLTLWYYDGSTRIISRIKCQSISVDTDDLTDWFDTTAHQQIVLSCRNFFFHDHCS